MMAMVESFARTWCPHCAEADKQIAELNRELKRHLHARNAAQARMVQLEAKLQMARSDSFDRESGLRHAINACGGVGPLAKKLEVQEFVIRRWLDSD